MNTPEFWENLYKDNNEMREMKEEIRRLRIKSERMSERESRREDDMRDIKLRLRQLEALSMSVHASL